MASSRRKQDEKNLKTLRELGSQPSNRICFDCHQKGTTYINMTVGSFVCTSCSGILRGLNPPHRVKSISMASFTQEEIEQIKSKGNQYCGAVWLGLYDAKISPFPDTKDEHKIRDFMIMKYEKKRFYIEPSIAVKNMPPQNSSATSSNASTPSSETSKAGPTANTSVSRPNVSASQSSGSVSGGLTSATNTASKNSTPKSSASLDLLADLGNQSGSTVNSNDPFASPTSSKAPTSVSQPSFANFENANIFTNTPNQPSQREPESACQTLKDQPCTVALPPPPLPSTRTPSPRLSPVRFTNWEAFEGEVNAGTPLIPLSETFLSPPTICNDASGRQTNKGKIPNIMFASGVSAQFVCPTNVDFKACSREEAKVVSSAKQLSSISNSSTMNNKSNWHVSPEPRTSQTNSFPTASKSVQASQLQAETSLSHTSSHQLGRKLPHNPNQSDFSYSALNMDSFQTENVKSPANSFDVPENNRNYFHLNTKSNEISSKCFAAFLSSTSKLSGTSYQNLSSETGSVISCSEKKNIGDKSLTREYGYPKPEVVSNSVVSVLDNGDKTNPFESDGASLSAPTDDNAIFDKVPLFTKRRAETSKPIPVSSNISTSSSLSSSFPSACPPRASLLTNPFVSILQPATNARQNPPSAGSAVGRIGSLGDFSCSDMFLHENLVQQQQPFQCVTDSGMTPAHLAGSTSSNKSTPLGPHLPFSTSPLTPMAPGSSSNPPPASVPNTQSSSNPPVQDRYAALKDLDEEFKTQKESETVSSNDGGSWPIPNGSHQNSSVFRSPSSTMNGSVFGSPGTSNNVFGTVNGGGSGGIGVFGTPPNAGNAWANFTGANPFSGCNNGAPWMNGGGSLATTHTQQGFGSVVQPNPFGTTPDPNFNQFGNNAPINGTSSANNGAWANFNQHPQNTKMQWMTSNGTANPFMATPQMPSSGSSYNPFL
ncbi:Arf-GAP domain and FG repeat-containing protein 1-like [Homarus americanus]|uniref:Arf-GAP domain and FG repeat-containing protein 1-like n=1 Tax=Homarus americanus TaxID=6706 RepID=A0A8J5T975_HOMAM|nr:Arf-GAP domain and FG repeat-containing protein 1-like [Homarus americanus]